MGEIFAKKGLTLIYGGAQVGLMGVLADSVLANGGKAIGVIPEFLLKKEVGHSGLSELIVVETMHERKSKMAELSDGFIAMPGGFGTLDELCEILTWAQLDLHRKPIGLLNSGDYFSLFMQFADLMVSDGFVRKEHRELLLSAENPADLINKMEGKGVSFVEKWMDKV